MALEQKYIVNLDLKRAMTSTTPTFRLNDNAILIFDLYDDGIEYLIDDAVQAEVTHESPTGSITVYNATFTTYNGRKTVRFNYENRNLIEAGIYKVTVTVKDNRNAVSFQPFPVLIYSEKNSSSTLVDLLKELNKYISDAMLSLRDAIMLSEKGKPNGVATLDASGKIPLDQLPPQIDSFKKHITETIWKNQVHGMRIDKDGILQYDTSNNSWQNVGFAPTAVGGGGSGTQLLDASITKSNGVATVTYIGVPTVQVQKWVVGEFPIAFFQTGGTTFTGNKINYLTQGIHTLYYKDSNGVEYTKLFLVYPSDFATPTISVSVDKGDVTVNISQATSIKKWAKGRQGIPYFQSQGTVFTGNMFTITEVGWYTIYYKTINGAEYIYQFEITFAQLYDALPIIVNGDSTYSEADDKYRSFLIGINDSRVNRIKYTGHDTSVRNEDILGVYEDNGYYYPAGATGYVNVTRNSGDMTIEFTDTNGVIYGTAVHKCRVNYNYFVINNQYVSLTRIKNGTTNYTLPTTIEGLPVLDAGCVLFTNVYAMDGTNIKNLTVPSGIINGGRFATNTDQLAVPLESVRIENPEFKLNHYWTLQYNAPNFVIYAPNNSTIFNHLRSKGKNVQPL